MSDALKLNINYILLFSSYPHGEFTFIPTILVTVAFFLTCSAHKWCEYAKRTPTDDVSDGIVPTYNGTTIGLWSFQGTGQNEGGKSC